MTGGPDPDRASRPAALVAPPALRQGVGAALHAGLLLAVAGGAAWLTGHHLIFPSLGPSAFLLALGREAEAGRARRVFGGHFLGVVAGLLSYQLFAEGIALTGMPAPLSDTGLRLAVSGVVSTGLTTGAMIATDTEHAPACATTLIVSLGLLSTVVQGIVIMAGVGAIYGAHVLVMRVAGSGGGDGTTTRDEPDDTAHRGDQG